jgi:hypothetical protein
MQWRPFANYRGKKMEENLQAAESQAEMDEGRLAVGYKRIEIGLPLLKCVHDFLV